MTDFPDIIAGPILRRVTNNRVCVWLATSRKLNITLNIMNQLSNKVSCIDSESNISYQLGKYLWVTLIKSWPEKDSLFPTDELLYYQLFDNDLEQEINLQSVCLNGHSYPNFFIPSQLKVIAHGSCRKPHGLAQDDDGKKIQIDALSLLKDQLEENSNDLNLRPALMCLTGDQIYADDVALPLINLLKQKALELIGEEFGVPEISKPSQLAENSRMEKLDDLNSGFTSGKGDNHLISFGEYAAMYIFVLGNVGNWTCIDGNDTESQHLKTFTDSLPKVRIALANIPTYMMFDDHEISDDWNISRNWYDSVRHSPTGRRIVSNALASYWAFQGWGNSPDLFEREFIRSICSHLEKPHDSIFAERFDLQMWKHRGWGYTLPTSPPIIALDCRTQRSYDSNYAPAKLMDSYALDWLRISLIQLRCRNVKGTPILISGSPVIGFHPIYKIKRFLNKIGISVTKLDYESWIANQNGFSYFMDTLLLKMELDKVLFLSGDVHYSYINKGEYSAAGKNLKIIQLTSSALHNSPTEGEYFNWLAKLDNRTEDHSGVRPTGILPWYNFWTKFSKNDSKHPIWKTKIKGVPAEANNRLVTNRPNIALVYFDNKEITKQSLVSGEQGSNSLNFVIPEFDAPL